MKETRHGSKVTPQIIVSINLICGGTKSSLQLGGRKRGFQDNEKKDEKPQTLTSEQSCSVQKP